VIENPFISAFLVILPAWEAIMMGLDSRPCLDSVVSETDYRLWWYMRGDTEPLVVIK
jgi:hypothetical protein